MSTVIALDPSPNTGGGQAVNNPSVPFITYSNGQMVLNVPSASKVVTNVAGNASNTLDDGSGNMTVTGTVTSGGVTTSGVTQASIASASSAISNTETLLVSVPLSPGKTLKVGSKIVMVAEGTCTSGAAGVPTFTIRAGTLGTTADASVAAIALANSAGSGTSIPFSVRIEMTVRTLGASGTAAGSLTLVNNTAATGIIGALGFEVVPFTSATLATTTATFLDLTYVAAAATTATCTFQDASIVVIP